MGRCPASLTLRTVVPHLYLVHRALDTELLFPSYVGVDHGGLNGGVAHELLDGPDVVSIFKKVRRKRMAKTVQGRVVEVMAPDDPAQRVNGKPPGGKDREPSERRPARSLLRWELALPRASGSHTPSASSSLS